jgi:hypothetical protein
VERSDSGNFSELDAAFNGSNLLGTGLVQNNSQRREQNIRSGMPNGYGSLGPNNNQMINSRLDYR